MNKEKTIKKILSFGFREYKPNSLESYERAWQKIIKKNELFIGIRFWEHSKYPHGEDNFDIMIYKHKDNEPAERINIYGFDDIDIAYKRVLKYIKFLK